MRVLLCVSLLACLSTACVPIALYNYATHDVDGEAKASDCQRMPDTCQVKP